MLVVGGGPSGIDLIYLISKTAKRVYFSHHTHNYTQTIPSNVCRVGKVKELTETGVIFEDGTRHDVDAIVYCTGYKTTFPFLSVDCGLCEDGKYISPLFKDIINIHRPTMAIIGLPYGATIAVMVDIQMRFVMKFWNGEKSLPSAIDMKADTERWEETRRAAGSTERRHVLHALQVSENDFLMNSNRRCDNLIISNTLSLVAQQTYYDELSAEADIENVRRIYMKIYSENVARAKSAPYEYRNDLYRIIDDDHFEIVMIGQTQLI